jgi:outer membrane receptor protein involved in Fe transport
MFLYGLLSLSSPTFAAGDAEEAEVAFRLGLTAYAEGDYDLALFRFLTSNRLAPNPAVAYNIARCYAKTERYAESYRWYSVAAESLDTEESQRAVQAGLAAIVPKVVVYDLTSDPPGADVYVGSRDLGVVGTTPLTLALEPSSAGRTFVFSEEGYEDLIRSDVRGEYGQTVAVEAKLAPIVGTVAIRGGDGAEVHLGTPTGPVLCVTPCEIELAPGTRILHVRREGFRDSALQLDVQANQRTEVGVDLAPNTGSILVQSSERGSLVEIDGVAAGFTPTVVGSVAVGERVVRVSHPGFTPVEQIVQVETDQQVELTDVQLAIADAVTAVSRRTEQASLAPSSITVITRAEIEAFRYPTLYEALRGVRGFAMTQDSIYGTATIRGFGQHNDYNNKILVLSDGALMNDNITGASYLLYDGMVDPDVVQQIEVVRGPGSVLYGAGAVSGVLNLVGADRSAPDGVTLRGGGYDRAFFGTGRVERDLSDAFGFRVELSGAGSQGRSETLDPRGPAEPLEVDGVERFAATTTSGRMWFGSQATAQWFYTWRRQYIPTGAFTTNFGSSDDNYWADQRGLVELRGEPRLSGTTALYSRLFSSFYQYDGSFPIGRDLLYETYVGVQSGAELRVITEPAEAVRLQLGAQGTVSPLLALDGEYIPARGATEPYLDESETLSTASVFGLVDLEPSRLLALSLGVRGDYWSTFGFAPSPRLAAVLQPTDRDVVKLIAGRAFRAPSVYETYYNSPGAQARSDYDGNVLDPETVWSGEAEYSHRFGALWTVLLAGHGSQADGLIETVPVDAETANGVFVYRNSGLPIRILGADAEIRRAFQSGLLVTAFYSYLDARYGDGAVVPNAPRHQTAFKLVLPVAPPEVRLAIRGNLEGTRRIDPTREDTTDLALVVDVVMSGEAPLLGIDYAVGMYNALDMDYEQPLTDAFPMRTIAQPGRSLMFDVSKSF